MVNLRGRAGKGTSGCLTTLVLFGIALYFGLPVADVYVRQYQFAEEMRSQARLAPSLTDAVIRRRLEDKADALDLPAEALKTLKIKRTGGSARRITIDAEYSETVVRPFFRHTFTFRPHAEEQL